MNIFYKKVVPGSTSRLTMVDHNETYGRRILEKIVDNCHIEKCLDIGCGHGDDLLIVKKHHSQATLFGVDYKFGTTDKLESLGIKPLCLDIEKDKLPVADESIDFIIANQVFEHVKEIFWLNHEIFRCLKVGGTIFIGVPNVLSLHNRILMMFGFHPTSNKMISAHVRVFSNKDVAYFYGNIGKQFCRLEKYFGSQFYPFPRIAARFLAKIFPTMAFSSFYVIKKIASYQGDFLKWPEHAKLETNFFVGQEDS